MRVLRLAAFIQSEIESHAALPQLFHHLLLFHKNNLMLRQRKTPANICSDGARPKSEYFYFCVDPAG